MRGCIKLGYEFFVSHKALGLSEDCSEDEFLVALDEYSEKLATLFEMQTDHIADEICIEII